MKISCSLASVLVAALAVDCHTSHHSDGGPNADAGFHDGGPNDQGGSDDLTGADLLGVDLAGVDLSSTSGLGISLLAGALGGRGNLDGVGNTARFEFPSNLATDGAGNLYVSDYCAVRKIVLATGAVSTLAGNSNIAGAVDGVGAAARFGGTDGIAADGKGNLFVGDRGNFTIRKIVIATGAVSTFAGMTGVAGSADGTGTAARFVSPLGLTSDGMGNVYVADAQVIRKIVIATGAVTTLAGSAGPGGNGHVDAIGAAAKFRGVNGITYTSDGSLYVTDSGSYTIRKVVIATGAVTTLAGADEMSMSVDGTGTAARFYQPLDIATDGTANLYVSDSGTIRKIELATAAVSTVAGKAGVTQASVDATGTAARFGDEDCMAVVGGNLYISDLFFGTVRKMVTATAVVTTFAGLTQNLDPSVDGTGAAARFYSGVVSVASDGAGNLYATSDNLIRKIVIATGVVTTLAGKAGVSVVADGTGSMASFGNPLSITTDGAGNLYVIDSSTVGGEIRKIAIATGVVTTLAGSTTKGSMDGTGTAAQFGDPVGLVADGAGSLYVSDAGNYDIRKIDIATAKVSTFAGQTQSTGGHMDGVGAAAIFEGPGAITYDGNGTLYVADNVDIRKIVVATATVTTLAGGVNMPGYVDGLLADARFETPVALTFDGAGHVYVADNYVVRRIDLAAGTVSTPVGVVGSMGVRLGPLPGSMAFTRALVAIPGGLAMGGESALLSVRGL